MLTTNSQESGITGNIRAHIGRIKAGNQSEVDFAQLVQLLYQLGRQRPDPNDRPLESSLVVLAEVLNDPLTAFHRHVFQAAVDAWLALEPDMTHFARFLQSLRLVLVRHTVC